MFMPPSCGEGQLTDSAQRKARVVYGTLHAKVRSFDSFKRRGDGLTGDQCQPVLLMPSRLWDGKTTATQPASTATMPLLAPEFRLANRKLYFTVGKFCGKVSLCFVSLEITRMDCSGTVTLNVCKPSSPDKDSSMDHCLLR